MVEFAFSVTVLALLLVGIIDLSRVFYFDTVVSGAASEGARWASSGNEDNDYTYNNVQTAGVITIAQNSAPAGIGSALVVTVTPSCADRKAQPEPVWATVTVKYTFTPFTPFISNLIGSQLQFTRRVSQRMRSDCV